MKRVKRQNSKRTHKAKWIKLGWLSFLLGLPLVALACGTINPNLITNSLLSQQIDLAQVPAYLQPKALVTNALKSNEGLRAFVNHNVDQATLNWVQQAVELDTMLNQNWQVNQRLIDNEISEEKANTMANDGADFLLTYQQNVLDQHGGTPANYLLEKQLASAKNLFTQQVFKNFFLTVFDKTNNQVVLNPSPTVILQALLGTIGKDGKMVQGAEQNEYVFAFDANSFLNANEHTDYFYEQLQAFVLQKYLELINPFIIHKVFWQADTSSNNTITNLYTLPTGEISNQAYKFPLFSNANENNTNQGTLTKFHNFANFLFPKQSANQLNNESKLNVPDQLAQLGLHTIASSLSDDGNVLAFVTNNTLYDTNSAAVANGIAYLYGLLPNAAQPAVNPTNLAIGKQLNLTSNDNNPFDAISKNFVSPTPLFANGSLPSTSNAGLYQLQLPASYVSQLINNQGAYQKVANKPLYVIDNFVATGLQTTENSTSSAAANAQTGWNWQNFLFTREQNGVFALQLDGLDLLKTAKDAKTLQQYGLVVVLYRYFLGLTGTQQNNFTIDLKTELTNFFNTHYTWLMAEFAKHWQQTNRVNDLFIKPNPSHTTNFQYDFSFVNAKLLPILTTASQLLMQSPFFAVSDGAINKIMTDKGTLNTNVGVNATLNGLAAPFNYPLLNQMHHPSGEQANGMGSNQTNLPVDTNPLYFYDHLRVVNTALNPFVAHADNQPSLFSQLHSAIDQLGNSMENADLFTFLTTSDFAGFQFSQQNFLQDTGLQAALHAFLSGNSTVRNYIENNILQPLLPATLGFDFSKWEFVDNNSGDPNLSRVQNQALFNHFLAPMFLNNQTALATYGVQLDANYSLNYQALQQATRAKLLKANAQDLTTHLNNLNQLLKILITYQALQADDGALFLEKLRNVLVNNNGYLVWNLNQNSNLNTLKNVVNEAEPVSEQNVANSSFATLTNPIKNGNIALNWNNTVGGYYFGLLNPPATGAMAGGASTKATESNANVVSFNPQNLLSNAMYQNNLDNNYYKAVMLQTSNMTNGVNQPTHLASYYGLITNANDTKGLNSEVVDVLFNNNQNPNLNKQLQGSLALFASKKQLVNRINELNRFTDLNNLATQIDQLTFNQHFLALQLNNQNPNNTLTMQKSFLANLVETLLPDAYFVPFVGFLGEQSAPAKVVTNFTHTLLNFNQNATFVIQLQPQDVVSLNALRSKLTFTINAQNQIGNNMMNGIDNANMVLNFVGNNLVVDMMLQLATQPALQTEVINKLITKDQQIVVNDIRFSQAFGNDANLFIKNRFFRPNSNDNEQPDGMPPEQEDTPPPMMEQPN